jgi:1-deoxy-D-xylulose-5-phosphate reductoisomerase
VIPSVLNGANEEAVAAFLQGRIKFLEIAETVMKVTREFENVSDPTVDEIISAGLEARARVRALLG